MTGEYQKMFFLPQLEDKRREGSTFQSTCYNSIRAKISKTSERHARGGTWFSFDATASISFFFFCPFGFAIVHFLIWSRNTRDAIRSRLYARFGVLVARCSRKAVDVPFPRFELRFGIDYRIDEFINTLLTSRSIIYSHKCPGWR